MAEVLASGTSSASRQKSCHACVKGKRGCDKRHPVCSRCEEKNIQCIYTKRTYTEAFHEFNSVDLDMSWERLPALSSSIDFVDDSLTPLPSLDHASLPTLDAFTDPFLTFTENEAMSSSDMQLISIAGEPLGQQLEKDQALSKFDYGPMADLCVCGSPIKECQR